MVCRRRVKTMTHHSKLEVRSGITSAYSLTHGSACTAYFGLTKLCAELCTELCIELYAKVRRTGTPNCTPKCFHDDDL